MSSKNARKKDAADKYLERKIKALDQTETRMVETCKGYKDDLFALYAELRETQRTLLYTKRLLEETQALNAGLMEASGLSATEMNDFVSAMNAKKKSSEDLRRMLGGMTDVMNLLR